ncbi:MAG: hypothetical protein HC937_00620 [Aquincola sp.]|nr:hypothetical protein [Aquincola sp.]
MLGEIPGDPFKGFKLRMSDVVTSVTAMAVTTGYATLVDLSANPIVVALAKPEPGRRYLVRSSFNVETVSATAARFDAQLEGSFDGVTFFTAGGCSVNTEADNETVKVMVDMEMQLGAEFPIPVATQELVFFRMRVAASAQVGSRFRQPPGSVMSWR